MMHVVVAAAILCLASPAPAQQEVHQHRSPPDVAREREHAGAPSDAIVLFDGSSLDAWESVGGGPVPWTIEDGVLVVRPGSGSIRTKRAFGAMSLHVEFNIPESPDDVTGQARGNSGVYVFDRYEVQILDSGEAAPANNLAGAIYGQRAPLVNAARAAGQWQTYDIDFAPPTFDSEGHKIADAMMTVRHNGVVIHERATLPTPTGAARSLAEVPAGPITLQDHASPIRFRNIYLVERAHAISADTPPLFEPIFDGKTLEGWVQRGGRAEYRAEDGCIVGQTRPNQPNSFLCTEREYADFELDLEFTIDDELNSGVQIRSASSPDYNNGVVHGYQVEIDPSNRAYTCGIYEEAGRGWLDPLDDNKTAREAYRPGEWNRVRVWAEGSRIRTWINGIPAADINDDRAPSGFFGLQVHGVGARVEPLTVRWRNIRVRELRPE